jgi:hypothetical protein
MGSHLSATWVVQPPAPVGQGSLALDGHLFIGQLDQTYRGEDGVYLLRRLLRQIAGAGVGIWNGLPAYATSIHWRPTRLSPTL